MKQLEKLQRGSDYSCMGFWIGANRIVCTVWHVIAEFPSPMKSSLGASGRGEVNYEYVYMRQLIWSVVNSFILFSCRLNLLHRPTSSLQCTFNLDNCCLCCIAGPLKLFSRSPKIEIPRARFRYAHNTNGNYRWIIIYQYHYFWIHSETFPTWTKM